MDLVIKVTIELIIIVLAFVLGKYVIPTLKSQIGDDGLKQMHEWATILVHAAEQIFTNPGAGSEKYEYVYEALSVKMLEYGVDLSSKDIKNIIEECVYVMNNSKKEK